jgi:amphi-Trp domain-containing protein
MAARKGRRTRDVEKDVPARQFAAKLRRLADAIERGERFRIQVAGERVVVPPDAAIQVAHERGAGEEELELQLVWKLPA